ncbi:MAG: ParB N-terminal domain-containing protein [Rhodoblastus sp.]
MIVRAPRNVRLSDIVGVSPLNPRHQVDDADLDGLADSIVANGVIEDILVERSHVDGKPIFLCLDGSRRWRALQRLAEQGRIQPDSEIRVVEITGREADLREIALAVNFHRLGLHPIEQYEAFAGMARYRTTAEIAAHFRLDQRDVIKALALGRDLAPEIRAAWKAEEITADAAKAYTVARDHTRQLETFHALSGEARNDAAQIRRLLRGDAVVARHSLAIFAKAEYLGAGGAIDQGLFEEHAFFEDGPLLRRLAEDKLRARAEEIRAAQGWKWAITQFDDTPDMTKVASADMTPEDRARLDAIEAQDLGGCEEVEALMLATEAEEIELRAWSRGVPKSRRAELGFVLTLDQNGRIVIDGGFLRAVDRAPAPEASDDDEVEIIRAAAPAVPEHHPALLDETRKLKAIRDAALSRAIADCAAVNINLALAIAVATMGVQSRSIAQLSATTKAGAPHDLLDEIAGMAFDVALVHCVRQPLGDLTTAFAALVARSIDVGRYDVTPLGPIVRAVGRLSNIAGALHRALDRDAWFEAAPKQGALDALAAMQGAKAVEPTGSRKEIAALAAAMAVQRKWLPAPWSDWLADLPPPPAPAPAPTIVSQAQGDEQAVQLFLDARTRRGQGLRVRATELHDAFVAWAIMEGIAAPPGLGAFGTILTRLGLQRWRHKTGRFYLDVALAPAVETKIAAE